MIMSLGHLFLINDCRTGAQALGPLNEEFQKLGLPALAIRIGIHTGAWQPSWSWWVQGSRGQMMRCG